MKRCLRKNCELTHTTRDVTAITAFEVFVWRVGRETLQDSEGSLSERQIGYDFGLWDRADRQPYFVHAMNLHAIRPMEAAVFIAAHLAGTFAATLPSR